MGVKLSSHPEPTKDLDIRRVLLSNLVRKYKNEPTTIVIEELGLCQGEVRVDVAVVNGAIHGFEIKSDQDTLKRLNRQSEIYNRALDFVTLVVGTSHLNEALTIIPEWWGILEARRSDKGIVLHKFRTNKRSPALDPEAIVQLIWRDEALQILRKRHLHEGYLSKTKWVLWERLMEALSMTELKAEVRNVLKSRVDWRSVEQPV